MAQVGQIPRRKPDKYPVKSSGPERQTLRIAPQPPDPGRLRGRRLDRGPLQHGVVHVHPDDRAGLTDVRLSRNSLGSFAANIADGSFHSVFATYDPTIFNWILEL